MKLLLIRHGETSWNKEQRLQGRTNISLNETGVEQIRHTAHLLAQTADCCPSRILCSPLQRARHSAEIIAKELHMAPDQILDEPLFIERSFGVCEGLTYEEALTQYPDGIYPGMETLEQLCLRAQQTLEHCAKKYPDQTILAVSHGAMIKALLVVASEGRIGYFDKDIWIENGSCCALEIGQESISIVFEPLCGIF